MSEPSVEQLVSLLRRLRKPSGLRRHAEELVPDRVYLAQGPTAMRELFLKGDRASFEEVIGGRLMQWDEYHIEGSSSPLPALVVCTEASDRGTRLLAHIAYEACRMLRDDPTLPNRILVERLRPFFALVLQTSLLSDREQTGLMAELLFLHRLLSHAQGDPDAQCRALSAWVGPTGSRRDFFARGTAVEVKASSSGSHHDVSMSQLLPADDGSEEQVYLCSVRVQRDRSAPLKLPEQVRRVQEALDEEASRQMLREKLAAYGGGGYDVSLASQYRLEAGYFADTPRLRRIDASTPILRPTSFRAGEPPGTVSAIRYTLDVSSVPPLLQSQEDEVLLALLKGSP